LKASARLDPQRDASTLGELDRVDHEVEEDLPEPELVGYYGAGDILPDLDGELEPLARRLERSDPLDHREQLAEVHRTEVELELPAFDLGAVEEVVDEAEQGVRLVQDDHGAPMRLLDRPCLDDDLSEADDAVERSADLVGDVRHEAGLHVVRLVRGFLGLAELEADPDDGGYVPSREDHRRGGAGGVALRYDVPVGVDPLGPLMLEVAHEPACEHLRNQGLQGGHKVRRQAGVGEGSAVRGGLVDPEEPRRRGIDVAAEKGVGDIVNSCGL
jgi:hypothetical protein